MLIVGGDGSMLLTASTKKVQIKSALHGNGPVRSKKGTGA